MIPPWDLWAAGLPSRELLPVELLVEHGKESLSFLARENGDAGLRQQRPALGILLRALTRRDIDVLEDAAELRGALEILQRLDDLDCTDQVFLGHRLVETRA